MSEIQCVCPFCSSMFSVDGSYEGQEVSCPSCGNDFLVQRMSAAPMSAPVFPSQAQYLPPTAQRMPKTETGSSGGSSMVVVVIVLSILVVAGVVALVLYFSLKRQQPESSITVKSLQYENATDYKEENLLREEKKAKKYVAEKERELQKAKDAKSAENKKLEEILAEETAARNRIKSAEERFQITQKELTEAESVYSRVIGNQDAIKIRKALGVYKKTMHVVLYAYDAETANAADDFSNFFNNVEISMNSFAARKEVIEEAKKNEKKALAEKMSEDLEKDLTEFWAQFEMKLSEFMKKTEKRKIVNMELGNDETSKALYGINPGRYILIVYYFPEDSSKPDCHAWWFDINKKEKTVIYCKLERNKK